MDADKALERIQMLLQRTEARGASEAEESTAARMICKLLRDFPELIGGQPVAIGRQRASEIFNERTHPDCVSIRYDKVLSQDDHGVDVVIGNKVVWLPFRQIKIKTSVIWMPRSLAIAKGLK